MFGVFQVDLMPQAVYLDNCLTPTGRCREGCMCREHSKYLCFEKVALFHIKSTLGSRIVTLGGILGGTWVPFGGILVTLGGPWTGWNFNGFQGWPGEVPEVRQEGQVVLLSHFGAQ